MMVATESKTDVYELLGISPDASSALAREMYWSKIGEYLEAERQGETSARQAIDALNEALNIVLDASLRREYDHALAETRPAPLPEALAPNSSHVWSVLVGMQLIAVVAAAATGVLAGTLPALGVAFIGTSTTVGAWIGFRHLRPLAGSPFVLLGLDATASLDEVELAYETRVQELLVKVHRDPGVVSQLELVDRAYVRACALIAVGEASSREAAQPAGDTGAVVSATNWLVRHASDGIKWALLRVVRGLFWLARVAVHGTQRLVNGVARWVRDRASRTPTPLLQDSYDAPYADSGDLGDDLAAAPAPRVDMNRRLAAGFKKAAERIAETDTRQASVEVAADATPAQPITSYIVLGGIGGARRVGIGGTPIKIGSADSCDLVLPEDSGVSPEHALIWRHDDAIVLHVTDHSAACLVNERPMTWATLEGGDEVRMGTFRMHIEVDGADSQ